MKNLNVYLRPSAVSVTFLGYIESGRTCKLNKHGNWRIGRRYRWTMKEREYRKR